MTRDFKQMNGVKIRFMGPTNYRPSRYCFEWMGYPSDGMKPVRKYVSANRFNGPTDKALMEAAAQAFVDWLNIEPKGWDSSVAPWTKNRVVDSFVLVHSFDARFDVLAVKYAFSDGVE